MDTARQSYTVIQNLARNAADGSVEQRVRNLDEIRSIYLMRARPTVWRPLYFTAELYVVERRHESAIFFAEMNSGVSISAMIDHDHRDPAPTILVVDDESMIVNLVAAMLRDARFTVITALGSPEALKICAELEPHIDLLLTDLVLAPPTFQLASENERFPYVHGHELAKRATIYRKELRVAFMSGNPDVALAQQGIKRGTLPFLSKPFSVEQLVAFVQGALAGPAPVFLETTATKEVTWFG